MDAREIIGRLESLRGWLPWLERVEVDLRDDSSGEPAVFVRLVVRSGIEDIFEDGARLTEAQGLIHGLLRGIGIWPFAEFVSADEAR